MRTTPPLLHVVRRAAPASARCVPTLVHELALEAPCALAVAAGERSLTYWELDSRANRLAAELVELGVGPEVLVGLHAARSLEMVLGALAILKAGGAYLPLDPKTPLARLQATLADARCRFLVAAPRTPAPLLRQVEKVLAVELLGARASRPPEVLLTAEQLAYVIYTSGTTGQPRGVEITHASLMNLIDWHQRNFRVCQADRATQLAPVGFDAAVWELWPYLTAGASVHLPDDAIRGEPEALRDWLVAKSITLSFVPTALAERLLTLRWPATTPLRALLTGGEALHGRPPPELPFRVFNNYGPTEATVVATSGRVASGDARDGRPPIGHPIDNVEVYILDEARRPVPPGTPGELCIGGAAVARGYRNQPELTAGKFIRDPFSRRPGARVYLTGDRVRVLPDGQLAFLGRLDDQVKIRGVRIEPLEISGALNQHPAVKESAVLARELGPGDNQLVAYLVLAPGPRPAPAELRSFLGARLPESMVPPLFVVLEALPAGPSGKLDRRALPAPNPANTLRELSFTPPRTELEERVAAIVAPLLGLTELSVHDDFFFLGGHSLMGARLIVRLREVLGVELNLRAVFDAPTVEKLSLAIEQRLVEALEAMSDDEASRQLGQLPSVERHA